MKKIFLVLFIVNLAVPAFCQQDVNQQRNNEPAKSHEAQFGNCTRKALTDSLFLFEYRYYKPDISSIYALRPILVEISITVVLGTKREDSQNHIPHFFKIMDMMKGYDNYHLICIDRNKQAVPVSVAGLNIVKVPTFIVYRKGIEIGRIVETPKQNLEKDLLAIIVKERN